MKKFTQKGFAHLGVVLLLLVVVVIALVGYKVAKNRNNTTTPSTVTKAAVQTIPVIKNKADLNTVETTLNNQNIDANLNPNSFDQDTQSLQ